MQQNEFEQLVKALCEKQNLPEALALLKESENFIPKQRDTISHGRDHTNVETGLDRRPDGISSKPLTET